MINIQNGHKRVLGRVFSGTPLFKKIVVITALARAVTPLKEKAEKKISLLLKEQGKPQIVSGLFLNDSLFSFKLRTNLVFILFKSRLFEYSPEYPHLIFGILENLNCKPRFLKFIPRNLPAL